MSTTGGQQWVARCCERAIRAGVVTGMSLAHARALLPANITAMPFNPERDTAALTALAEWGIRFSPAVASDPPQGLLLDITGCQLHFGGDGRLVQLVAGAMARLSIHARIAAAPTFGAAWALARYGKGQHVVIESAQLRDALSPLPHAALRIEPAVIAALQEVGIERIEQLTAIPRKQLGSRFGAALLMRLDQAMGEAIETIEPVRPTPPPVVERAFDGPTRNLEGIEITLRELIVQLAQELHIMGKGVLRLRVQLDRADLPPTAIALQLSRPNRDPKHLWRLLAPKLEKVQLGFGVERLRCTALRVGVIRHQQEAAWEDHAEKPDGARGQVLGELVDQLVNRLGTDRVTRIEPVASYLPERAFTHRPLPTDGVAVPVIAAESVRETDQPSVLFSEPEPIDVIALIPDGPVARLRWRGMDYTVIQAKGPERVSLEWWQTKAAHHSMCHGRDYFKAETSDGRWLWLYREVETARWFIHGHWA